MSANDQNVTGELTEQALGSYSVYAQYVAETLLAQPSGSVQEIPNELKSVVDHIAVLTDPARIEAIKTSIADQMNKQSVGPQFKDLGDRISDVVLDTVAQGAGTVTITVTDPKFALLDYEYPPGSGITFIQADATGYLWPPIDINFPTGTNCTWRMCQVDAQTFTGQPNLTLTFEDRVVSWLREINQHMGGVSMAAAGSTLMGFFQQLVAGANKYLGSHVSAAGEAGWQPIRLVPLISSNDPNVQPPVTTVASAHPGAPLSRQNPNKDKQGLTRSQQNYVDAWSQKVDVGRSVTLDLLESMTLDQQYSAFGGDRP